MTSRGCESYVITCYYMLLHAITCYYMLLHAIACYYMLLHVITYYYMLLHPYHGNIDNKPDLSLLWMIGIISLIKVSFQQNGKIQELFICIICITGEIQRKRRSAAVFLGGSIVTEVGVQSSQESSQALRINNRLHRQGKKQN